MVKFSFNPELFEFNHCLRYPISLEFLNEIWIPNVFIYNLKTFQNVAVLKKLAGDVLKDYYAYL